MLRVHKRSIYMAMTMAASMIEMPKRATRSSFQRRKKIAKRVKDVRVAKKITIEDAARKADVSIWTWQRWERAKASIPCDRIDDVATALDSVPTRILLCA